MKTLYDIMKTSETRDGEGGFYPDPLSFTLTSFNVTSIPIEYDLNENDKKRPDILMYKAYGTAQYDDLVMLLNNIGLIDEVETGTKVYLPDKNDIDNFYIKLINRIEN